MFTPDRWISAFVNALGENISDLEEGSAALKSLILCMQKIPGTLSGKTSSEHLEKMIRHSMKESGVSSKGTEYACRLLVLLVKKRLYTRRNGLALIEEMERVIDIRHGVVTVKVDSPFPLDENFKTDLSKTLREKLGIKEIRLVYRSAPELLGGYKLRIGDISVDASLSFLLKNLTARLEGTSNAMTEGGIKW